jgi:hypothetical protein
MSMSLIADEMVILSFLWSTFHTYCIPVDHIHCASVVLHTGRSPRWRGESRRGARVVSFYCSRLNTACGVKSFGTSTPQSKQLCKSPSLTTVGCLQNHDATMNKRVFFIAIMKSSSYPVFDPFGILSAPPLRLPIHYLVSLDLAFLAV